MAQLPAKTRGTKPSICGNMRKLFLMGIGDWNLSRPIIPI
jgi:hypothetical protein